MRTPVAILAFTAIVSLPRVCAPNAGDAPGGLTAWKTPDPGPNLVLNPGFETAAASGKPVSWADNGFTLDTTVAHSGSSSFRLTGANTIPYTQSASQNLALKKGVYRVGVWVKTRGLAATIGMGVRLCFNAPVAFPHSLVSACTAPVKGTADWQFLQADSIVVPQDITGQVLLDAYGDPDGTAWFDDVEVTRQQMPLQVFLRYPNYRGTMFDDQPQTADFSVAVEARDGAAVSDYQVNGKVVDETSGAVVMQQTFPAAETFDASLDLSALPGQRSYLASFQLSRADGSAVYTYPAYRIVKAPAARRASMPVTYDRQNRFLLHGKPAFVLGVYDSGMGYAADETTWTNLFTTSRRLFELPINFYLNYWYGAAPNSSMLPMMDVLESHGIYNLTNANCFSGNTVEQMGATWLLSSTDAVVRERTAHPYFGGFYAADECVPALTADVFGHYQGMKSLAPGSIALGVLLPDANLPLWRDAVDVVATDPYPMYGAEPSGGYPFGMVADATARAVSAVQASRPVITVVQFFQFTSLSRWPTRGELRSMSYAAIAGGASGLFYWSLGGGALAYICDGSDAAHSPSGSTSWCQARIDRFEDLKAVLTELKGLAPVLALPDRPELLRANANAAIRTRVKANRDVVWVIAFNASNTSQSVSLQLGAPVEGVQASQRSEFMALRNGELRDSLEAWGARVYRLQSRQAK